MCIPACDCRRGYGNLKFNLYFYKHFLFILTFVVARRTRNSQPTRQAIGVRLATDGSHAPATRVPTPRPVRTTVSAAAPAATTVIRCGRVADVCAQATDRGRLVTQVQPLGRHADVRWSFAGRRPLAVHEPEQRGPIVDVRGTVSTGQLHSNIMFYNSFTFS